VGRTGKVLGCRTLTRLHDAAGHPRLATTHRGALSLKEGVPPLLRCYEQATRGGPLVRLVVDREGIGAEWLAELVAQGRTVVTVLRSDQYQDLTSFTDVSAFVPLCQKRGQGRTPTPYGISRRTPRQVDAARLLALGRAHGRLEDRLHWRWDVTLREDHCQVRIGAALLVRAALNNLLLAIFDLLGVQNVKEQMPRLDAQPQRVVRLLLGSLLTFTSPWGILPFLLTTSSPF
jgi:hypothetical protein